MVAYSDLVYYLSLLACITTGEFYKNISDRNTKRYYGTGLGLLITYLICGPAAIHSVLMVWGNIVIIKCCNKKYVHQLSLAYTWLYIIYMNYHNVDVTTNYVLWVHQAIALRLVGLAFEITAAEKSRLYIKRYSMKAGVKISSPKLEDMATATPKALASQKLLSINDSFRSSLARHSIRNYEPVEPNAADVISYAYYFIGLHRGPYYRWKTFNEHFKTPFGTLSNCRAITERKLKKIVVYGLINMVLSRTFPVQAYNENDFYYSHGSDYRYLYNIPQLLMYVIQFQVVMMLCASVCTEAGFGVYPTKTQPVAGYGPTTKFSMLNLDASSESVALEQEYNFAMLRSFRNDKLLMGPRMKDTLRGWDMSTRYWFWMHTYKNMVVRSNKEVRSAISFLAWSLWCGPTMQQTVICSTVWVHLQLEKEYAELYNTSAMKVPWDIGFSIMRLFCLIYLTPCLILRDCSIVLRYYNSIYWVYHVVLLFLILGAVVAQKQRTVLITSL